MRPRGLRTVKFKEPELSEVARDIDAYMRGTRQLIAIPQFDALYTEPMFITCDEEPLGIQCIRVRPVNDLEGGLPAGGVCPFVYEGNFRRARVQSVPGLSTGLTTYRFDFVLVV